MLTAQHAKINVDEYKEKRWTEIAKALDINRFKNQVMAHVAEASENGREQVRVPFPKALMKWMMDEAPGVDGALFIESMERWLRDLGYECGIKIDNDSRCSVEVNWERKRRARGAWTVGPRDAGSVDHGSWTAFDDHGLFDDGCDPQVGS